MESSLHRQLKEFYCDSALAREVSVDGFRVDAIVGGRLIEIQNASLGALRRKVARLLERHRVVVVKPLVAHKTILRRDKRNGPITSRRTSPRHERLLDLFHDLVHFIEVFPHPGLTLEVLLTEQEEVRLKRRARKRWQKDYRVEDRTLVAIHSRHVLATAGDLASLLPPGLPEAFTTADLAQLASIPRWLAQKMAYCLRRTGAIELCGKSRNALCYRRSSGERAAA